MDTRHNPPREALEKTESFLCRSFGLTSGSLKARMGVAIALSAVVHRYGEVLSARSEFRSPSFDPSRRRENTAPPQDERNPIMAYARDDGFFETDRDREQRGH